MKLNDPTWSSLEGGYRILYDPSIVLKELESTTDPAAINKLCSELWDNLHHQGDVGTASYLSVPSLVDICIKKTSLDWNFIGLCLVIEHCRRSGNNPEIPGEFEAYYFEALTRFEDYLLSNFKRIDDPTAFRLTLAFLATMHGQFDLGQAIENLDEDVLKEFLEDF
jgi:hypothetical protein